MQILDNVSFFVNVCYPLNAAGSTQSLSTPQFSALGTSQTAENCHHATPQHTQLQKARGSLRSKSQARTRALSKQKQQTGNNNKTT